MNKPNHKSKIENSPPPSPHPIPMMEYLYILPMSLCISIGNAIGTSGGFIKSFFIGIHQEFCHAA